MLLHQKLHQRHNQQALTCPPNSMGAGQYQQKGLLGLDLGMKLAISINWI